VPEWWATVNGIAVPPCPGGGVITCANPPGEG
jgi:hypothetical protein